MPGFDRLLAFIARHRRRLIVAGVCLCIALPLWYVFLVLCWPSGMPARYLLGYWSGFNVTTTSVAPSGKIVQHVLLDAGAMSHGPGIEFVIYKRDWWQRARVLVCGWAGHLSAADAINWVDQSTFTIELSDRPHDRGWRVRTVTVP